MQSLIQYFLEDLLSGKTGGSQDLEHSCLSWWVWALFDTTQPLQHGERKRITLFLTQEFGFMVPGGALGCCPGIFWLSLIPLSYRNRVSCRTSCHHNTSSTSVRCLDWFTWVDFFTVLTPYVETLLTSPSWCDGFAVGTILIFVLRSLPYIFARTSFRMLQDMKPDPFLLLIVVSWQLVPVFSSWILRHKLVLLIERKRSWESSDEETVQTQHQPFTKAWLPIWLLFL